MNCGEKCQSSSSTMQLNGLWEDQEGDGDNMKMELRKPYCENTMKMELDYDSN
jgi:hypothetical protein